MKKKIIKRQTKKTQSKQLIFVGIIIVITLGVLSYLKNLYSSPFYAPLDINQVGVSNGVVDLTLTPSTNQVEAGGELVLTLSISPGSYKVGDVTVELTYDESKVGTPVLTQGSYLTDKMGTPTVAGGKINFEYVAPTSGLSSGNGTIATIKLFPTGSGTTTLAFTDKTEVVVVDPATGSTIASNMLKSATGATLTIGTTAASAEPSTPASAEPSSTASVAPSIAASVAPSATTQKPNKPTGLRHNCYDGGNKVTLRWDAVAGADSYKLRLDQKDGTGDKSVDGIKVTEGDTAIIPDQKYAWWVHSSKDGIDSEEARIDEIVCVKTTTTTPTPTPTNTPTPKPTLKPSTKPTTTPKASLKPSSSPVTSMISIPSPTTIGSLNDIFADQDQLNSSPEPTSKPGFLKMIALGWQAILEKIVEIFE